MVTLFLLLCATSALGGALPLDEIISVPLADPLPEMKAADQNMTLERPVVLFAGEMAAKQREVPTGETMDKEQLLAGEGTDGMLCPLGWSRYGIRCFIFINLPATWTAAERHCVHFGANLASVHSSREYHFLQELARTETGGFPQTWIGGTDAVEDRLWFWSDGSRYDYQNWCTGEPNNWGQREPCIEMNFRGNTPTVTVENRWNDFPCGERLPFICVTRLMC